MLRVQGQPTTLAKGNTMATKGNKTGTKGPNPFAGPAKAQATKTGGRKYPTTPTTGLQYQQATTVVWVACHNLATGGTMQVPLCPHAVWPLLQNVPQANLPPNTGNGQGPASVNWHTVRTQVGNYNQWANGHTPKQGPPRHFNPGPTHGKGWAKGTGK